TGKVVEYSVPQDRLCQFVQRGLQIDVHKEGRIYYGNMSQMQIVRLDPKTEKMETFKVPVSESEFGDGHLTMIDPAQQHLDGFLWMNVAFATGEAGGTWHVNLVTNTWTRMTYPPGSPRAQAYDVVADSKNNMYGMQMNNDKLWFSDGKTCLWGAGMDNDLAVRLNFQTGEFTEYLLPHETNVRHVEVEKTGPLSKLWLGDQHGNTLIRVEPLVP